MYEFWHERDLKAWKQITETKDKPSDRARSGANIRPTSVRRFATELRPFHLWCNQNGIPVDLRLAERAIHIAAYAEAIRAKYSTSTCHMRLYTVQRILNIVDPCVDTSHITAELVKTPRKNPAGEKKKAARLQDTGALMALGIALMLLAKDANKSISHAVMFRIGLTILFLAIKPLRLGNLIQLEIGKHIKKIGGKWIISIDGIEMKNDQYFSGEIPPLIAEWIEMYLKSGGHRETLCRGEGRDANKLFVSFKGTPLSREQLSKDVVAATGSVFDDDLSVHLFRNCLSTTVARLRPDLATITHEVLGNSAQIVVQHYEASVRKDASAVVAEYRDRLLGMFMSGVEEQ